MKKYFIISLPKKVLAFFIKSYLQKDSPAVQNRYEIVNKTVVKFIK